MARVFEEIDGNPLDISGATINVLNETVFIVGGKAQFSSFNPAFLSVRQLDLATASWKSDLVNSQGICDRIFHSSVSYLQKIFVFGGVSTTTKLPLPDAVEIIPTEFGCQVNTVFQNEALARHGHTASIVSAQRDKVAIYGGMGHKSSDLILFSLSPDPKIDFITSDGDAPHTRAFHSATVCGNMNQYLIVYGGRSGATVFGDLWVADLTNAFQDDNAAGGSSAKGKAAPKKGASTGPSASWTKLASSISCSPRYCHSAFVFNQQTQSSTLCIFGGVFTEAESGLIWQADLTVNSDAGVVTVGAFTGLESSCKRIDEPTNPSEQSNDVFQYPSGQTSSVYGQLVCPVTEQVGGSDDSVAFVLATGGYLNDKRPASSSAFNTTTMLVLNENSRRVAGIREYIELYKRKNRATEEDAIPTQWEYPNGDMYVGDLVRSQEGSGDNPYYRHGFGSMTYAATGDKYEGSWAKDSRQGMGKLLSLDGTIFEGEFADDEYLRGTLNRNGTVYSGDFKSYQYHGQGQLSDVDGEMFEGTFAAGKRHGPGRLTGIRSTVKVSGKITAKTGTVNFGESSINGEWSDDKLVSGTAQSLLIDSSGKFGANLNAVDTALGIYSGKLLKGLPHDDEASCQFVNGGSYTGSYKTGRRNGFGKIIYPNLDQYDGKWVANMRCGFGVWRSRKGETFEGLWENDKPHGLGALTLVDGTVDEGMWIRGVREGQAERAY